MADILDSDRNLVLVDNTAQAVFKHLDRIEDNRKTLGLRWIWELLQNARDSASNSGVRIHVRLAKSELRFKHDGKPFSSKEIAHLVYHGSTKIESFDSIGQFGSGFLSTHLLSRVVRIEGCLDDSRTFIFPLDRTGDTVAELHCSMERSWEAFKRSIQNRTSARCSVATSFVYNVPEQSRELVDKGLSDLHYCGPMVLAFCPDIASISVETDDAKWTLQRGDQEPLHEGHILSIRYQTDQQTLTRFVAIAEGHLELCAALQLRQSDCGLQVDQAAELVPKIFVLFPLIGTERLGLPFTINSKRFKPREDRDGIVLQGSSTGVRENRELLKKSIQQQRMLLEWCAKEQWRDAHRLLLFDILHLPDWVHKEDQWYRTLLATLVQKARTTPLLPTLSGDWIEPQAAWVPVTNDPCHRDRLWDLMSSWSDAPPKLSRREHLDSWSRNLKSWATLLNRSVSELEEALTTVTVAQLVSDAGSVEAVQQRLADGEALHWLISLLQLLQDAGNTRLFDEYHLLPSQAGSLRRRSDLLRDESVSDELKDIGEAFGIDIRNGLLHNHVEVDGIPELLVEQREPELLDKVLGRVKQECSDGTVARSLAPSVVRLLWWVVARDDYVDRLDGYPAPTTDERSDGITVVHLEPGCEASGRPLAPVTHWPEGAQCFASLFPKRKILSAAFTSPDLRRWQRLEECGYVNMSPLVETERVMDAFLPDEPLLEIDGTESHKSSQETQVSDLAFLNEQDIGLIDTVRRSRRRAIDFVRFLVEFVSATDGRAFEEATIDCECEQKHRIYRAAWLVPLRRRRWVPLDSNGRATRASAGSLADLLADSPDIAEQLAGESSENLMRSLGISRAELALRVVAEDESTRVDLIHSMRDLTEAAAGDADRVRELVTEIHEHPEIIESIEEQKSRRKKIQRNHDVGRLVEELLRQELESHGLIVRRTGRGSDFEIESDYIENGEEVWIELVDGRATTLIEVKSTRIEQVKMTPLQVKTACSLDNRFALCVVPLDDDDPTGETVREHCRFVFEIGAHLRSALTDYETLQEAADAARRTRGAIEIEVVEGQVRFRIGLEIWEDAPKFEQACGRFEDRE